MDLNLTERVSKQRSFSFPLRGWSLLNVVLLVINVFGFPDEGQINDFSQKGNRTSKTTFNNDQPRSGKEKDLVWLETL